MLQVAGQVAQDPVAKGPPRTVDRRERLRADDPVDDQALLLLEGAHCPLQGLVVEVVLYVGTLEAVAVGQVGLGEGEQPGPDVRDGRPLAAPTEQSVRAVGQGAS